MGLFNRKRPGWNCDAITNADGTRTCRRFEVGKDNNRFATGTEVNINVNPETCEPVFSNESQFLLDDDEKSIETIAKKMTSQCKKEKGL